MRSQAWRVIGCGVLLTASVFGQEVRRALPVNPTPIPRAQPARPLNPFDPSGGDSILNENTPQDFSVRPAPQVRPQPQVAIDPKSSAGAPAEPDKKIKDSDEDEIRLAPNQAPADSSTADPAKTQLAIADGLYARKLYDLAVPEYEKYLSEFLTDPGRAAALYRLADCYSNLGQLQASFDTYEMLINEPGSGEFIGNAAFRLASRAFDSKNFIEAAPLYDKAFKNAKSPEIRLTARYYEAKCLELLNRRAEAKPAYQDVIKYKDKNPYYDAARLSLAYFALDENRKQEALNLFSQLGQDATKPAVRAEALTRAGILAADLKQKDQADQLFKAAMALNAEGKWKQVAQLEGMKLEYEGDKFTQVLDSYAKNLNAIGDETKPSVLLIVANSYRQLGKQQKAIEVYNQLIRLFPNTPEAHDARYQRLIALDAVKDPNLISQVDSYLALAPNPDRADKAKLLKAQTLFQQNKFDLAAKIYNGLTTSTLADSYKADCYYAAGFSLLQIKDLTGAVRAFSGLIEKYPNHPMVVKALLKRAIIYQDARRFPVALADFDDIIIHYPDALERSVALLQKGLTLGQQENYPEMVSTFQLYLKDYPDAPGIAQAEYWIGWAAFEAKKYQEAINPLLKARQLNPEEYAEKCSLRLIFSYQNLADKSDAAKEVDSFIQADPKKLGLVLDVCRWLGAEYYNNTNFDQASKYLSLYVKNSQSEQLDKKILYSLAKSDVQIKNFQEALDVSNQFLAAAIEPADRAQGFLMLSKAQLGLQQFDAAIKSVEEALTLQPEGRLNAEARMQSGDIDVAKGDFANAARSYMSVALLYEDPEVTPDALERAYEAFQKAGNEPQADKTLSELRSRFPNYQAKASAG